VTTLRVTSGGFGDPYVVRFRLSAARSSQSRGGGWARFISDKARALAAASDSKTSLGLGKWPEHIAFRRQL